ncbi:MAG: S8 family serine peptidase [Clostridiales bacterium]|nr:S8 family serine peptidase [Clostridiales bacterium]
MKRIVAIILGIILILSSIVYALANEVELDGENIELMTEENKIFCNATLDDDFADDTVLIVFNKKTSKLLKTYSEDDFSKINAVSVEEITKETVENIKKGSVSLEDSDFNQILKIKLGTIGKEKVLEAVKELEKDENIIIAQPDYLHKKVAATPNDTYYSSQNSWELGSLGMSSAWNITKGNSNVIIGIIDTGVYAAHPDLVDKIDTSHSKSFATNNDSDALVDSHGGYGHGTLVASIAAAKTDNGAGIAGVAWNCKFASLRVSDNSNSYPSSAIANAITYAKNNGIKIVNCSICGTTYDPCWENAINNYNGLYVCCASNEGENIEDSSTQYRYPAKFDCDNMIVVTAIDSSYNLSGTINGFSYSYNYGPISVDLAAPGVNVYCCTKSGGYTATHGSSLAAPYVAGTAALILSKYPNISMTQLKTAILESTIHTSSLNGMCVKEGRLNTYAALQYVASHYYTVVYDKNGGSGSMSNTTVYYGVTKSLSNNTFTRTGYTFTGWTAKRSSDNKWCYNVDGRKEWYTQNSHPNGATKYVYANQSNVSAQSPVSGDTVTMYAQWSVNHYVIHYYPNGGSGSMGNTTMTYNVGKYLSTCTFTYSGKIFAGWYITRFLDGKYYYTNGSTSGWYTQGSQPSGYVKKLHNNQAYIYNYTPYDGDIVKAYAQWGALGDANIDGVISNADVTLIQQYIANLATLTDGQKVIADVTYDGYVTNADVTKLQQYLAGIIPSL